MVVGKLQTKLLISIGLLILSLNIALAGQLENFSSDGCSLFPDGTLGEQTLWCDCCFTHDIAYWQGGNRQQKKQADEALRECILQKTSSRLLANTMYYGVTLGGSPVFPNWYRWGYGWRYGRGFQSLNQFEKQSVKNKLLRYHQSTPKSQSFCDLNQIAEVKAKIKKIVHKLK
jgi:hypothetical protein